ncbi:type II CRISPR-associated endonuclease Cas1 [uncultured Cohaesibacter sp.]|uniref:type II CRISPR-associated endonuclease Cas1 n=1 Tax=uncultured Cohaesibacter sp. TaxID=1002546 RepID=UPI00292DF525|nr:type II CRISPR-associated endonuclease Cas1 [uncultured Cohaesibacter sp.]
MAWKGVHLTRPARLSVKSRQLFVNQDDGDTFVALEDIAWIVADNHQTTLSVALLSACAEAGIAIITSNSRHIPSALTLPFHSHHRTAAVAQLQVAAKGPLRKRLWQAITRAKIQNQEAVLHRLERKKPPPLSQMAAKVRSGDPDNVEARAARDYWPCLFEGFVRNDENDLRNKALNYAYAVLRGCVARALVAVGLIPAIGLHHGSQTNAFNLADDLIEPFRPLADLIVFRLLQDSDPETDLSRDMRQVLAAIPMCDVEVSGEVLSILHGCEVVAQSLVRVLECGDVSKFQLPTLPSAQVEMQGLVP